MTASAPNEWPGRPQGRCRRDAHSVRPASRRSAVAALLLVASLLPSGAGGVAAAGRPRLTRRQSSRTRAPRPRFSTSQPGRCTPARSARTARSAAGVTTLRANQSPPEGTFIAIDAEAETTCGIRSNGSLACWGQGFEPDGGPPIGAFKDVSVGPYHACAIRTDDTLACWGSGEDRSDVTSRRNVHRRQRRNMAHLRARLGRAARVLGQGIPRTRRHPYRPPTSWSRSTGTA